MHCSHTPRGSQRRSGFRRSRITLLAGVTALVLLAGGLMARDRSGCCVCGTTECEPICRLVTEERKISKHCWGTQREDFCVPGPSERCEVGCAEVCGDCDGPGDVQARPRWWHWTLWSPGSEGRIYTRTKLMKKTLTKQVPHYKWVVEHRCPTCLAALETPSLPKGTAPPPVPALGPDVRVLPVSATE